MKSLFSFKSVGEKEKEPVFCVRYLSVAVIANKRRRSNNMMKELVKIIEQESYAYRDPITDFVSCLYIDYDFHSAQKKLKVGRVTVGLGEKTTTPNPPPTHTLDTRYYSPKTPPPLILLAPNPPLNSTCIIHYKRGSEALLMCCYRNAI